MEPEVSVDIEVDTPDVTPEVTPDETVVIVEAPAPATETFTEADVEVAIDVALLQRDLVDALTRVGELEWKVSALEQREAAVEDAVDELAEQDEVIVEAVDEAIVESIEDATDEDGGETDLIVPDEAPTSAKVHPLFRPAKDWFGK